MFIKSLLIATPTKVIREINFHKGLNLIVDHTPESESETGNNVGKTTVLRLIDFCLGKDQHSIYEDPENKKEVYHTVKDFLTNNKVIITLTLVDDLENPTQEVETSRNFLSRKEFVCQINGKDILKTDFENELMKSIFPNVSVNKPTFRQIISHNIRYDELRLTNTLKTLDTFTRDEEYEALYLYLLGCDYEDSSRRQKLFVESQNEEKFKRRLEKERPKSEYKSALDIINVDIENLNAQKSSLNVNFDLDKDITALNEIKNKLNHTSSDITSLSIRKNIIEDTQKDFAAQKFDNDTIQLQLIYQQAAALIPNLQKTFDELVSYHNQMLENKVRFITEELPSLNKRIQEKNKELNVLMQKEKELSEKIVSSDTFEDFEKIINNLNECHQKKGEYESIISKISEVEDRLKSINEELKGIDEGLFSDDYKNKIDNQVTKFNKIFAGISEQVYNEKYALKCDTATKRGKQIYKFSIMEANFSTGKKQGEISCFDIAYTLFADQENIPCLHFLLNDKKELVHDSQLKKIADLVNKNNIQFVASILKDKIPDEWNNDKFIILTLAQNDKLFKIENK